MVSEQRYDNSGMIKLWLGSIVAVFVFVFAMYLSDKPYQLDYDKTQSEWRYTGKVLSLSIAEDGLVDVMLEPPARSDRQAGFVHAPVRFYREKGALTLTDQLYINLLQYAMNADRPVALHLSELAGGHYTVRQATLTRQ